MMAYTEYLLAKHVDSLRERPQHELCFEYPKRLSLRDFFKRCGQVLAKMCRAVCAYFERTAREHNQMIHAPEKWDSQKQGIYIRGLM